MQIKCRSNLVGGLASLGTSILLFTMIPMQIPLSSGSGAVQINQRFFPMIAAVVMGLMGIVMIIQSLVLKKDNVLTINIRDELRMLIYFAVVVVLAILMKYIGFLVSACLMIVFSFAYFRCRKIPFYIGSLVFVGIVFVFFKIILKIPLP